MQRKEASQEVLFNFEREWSFAAIAFGFANSHKAA
jgi:hypothetical protein